MVVYWLLVVVLIPLPLLDELIGQLQFKAICSRGKTELRPGSRGKTVQLERPSPVRVPNTLLLTKRLPWRYKDVTSGETVLSYDVYSSRGGIVARMLGLSESKDPLTFSGECHPGGVVDYIGIFKEHGISVYDPLLVK